MNRALIVLYLAASMSAVAGEKIPDFADAFLVDYCLDCHDADAEKGDLDLDFTEIDWTDPHSAITWAKVFDALEAREMPPEDKRQPPAEGRQALVAWLEESLSRFDPPGGTVLRRLNRAEYENSVRQVLGIPFETPAGFPADSEWHGFDNNGEGLVLSPPLLKQYFQLAGIAADLVIPPPKPPEKIEPIDISISPDGLGGSRRPGALVDGQKRYRLVDSGFAKGNSCISPTRFVAPVSGVYRIEVQAAAFREATARYPESDGPLILQVLANQRPDDHFGKLGGVPVLAEFKVLPGRDSEEPFTAEIELTRGTAFSLRWANSPLECSKDGGNPLTQRALDHWMADRQLRAAFNKINLVDKPLKEGSLDEMLALAADPDFNGADPDLGKLPVFSKLTKNKVLNLASLHMLRHGPALDVLGIRLSGPLRLIEDEETRNQKARTARFMGERGDRSDEEYAEVILRPFLNSAFRRPVQEEQLAQYSTMALAHQNGGHRFEDGIHLAIRSALCSPNFLYRGQRDGEMDDYDLAARLSYFLTLSPPDGRLIQLASSRSLSDPHVLEMETRRLLSHPKANAFLDDFVSQWLDLELLPQIMPDERLVNWRPLHLKSVTDETLLFSREVLRENHPVETFIDPDFTYLNATLAYLYGLKLDPELRKAFAKATRPNDLVRVPIPRGGRRGGILAHASVMMATANGVDTQPVLRGVWLLENILGEPPPAPPTNVPAIEPDISGAKSIRELLDRHTADPSCAGCHRKIDPLGFALENFDPVGQWREFYPVYEKDKDGKVIVRPGQPVDSLGELTDGTRLDDVTDLKRWLVEDIDVFSSCLASKLLTYATGRSPGFGDRKVIRRVVTEVRENGNGFQDLIVALVLSESFRMK